MKKKNKGKKRNERKLDSIENFIVDGFLFTFEMNRKTNKK